LKTFGFTKRQVAATVAWQASVIAISGTIVGTPLGVVLGRWLWTLFAREIYAVPDPTIPALPIVFVVLGALALTNAVAFFPGRVAARTQAALVLRAE
jgi:ABC-type lipoprotein release transport system permease subunit